MTPREVWSNESQERYVLAIAPSSLDLFRSLCERERCPMAVVGVATEDRRLEVKDPLFGNKPVDMDLPALLGKPPRMTRDVKRRRPELRPFCADGIDLAEAARRSWRPSRPRASSSRTPARGCCATPPWRTRPSW